MILTREIEATIVEAIRAAPDSALVLPDHAYGASGRVMVQVAGLPIDLHRHLHNILIRELGPAERMRDVSGVAGNVNPHLFEVVGPVERKPKGNANAAKSHCPAQHAYTKENTLVGKDGKRRCATCRRDRNRAYAAQRRKEARESAEPLDPQA